MSEQLPEPENHELPPSHELAEKEPVRHEHHEKAHKVEHQPDVEALKSKVEKEAKSGKETKIDNTGEKANSADHYLVTKELKHEALNRSLQRARKHMTAASRGFSKLIHQPAIDTASKVGEKTIARPTGILTGAIIALAGSSYLLWSARHYGYQYNYLVLFLLFVGGYLVGLIIEILIYTFRRLRGKR